MTEKPSLRLSAYMFLFGFLPGPHAKMQFGGKGALMEITTEAREDLTELLARGYVEEAEPNTSWEGREYYSGTKAGQTALAHWAMSAPYEGFNIFSQPEQPACFIKKGGQA
jgi:hypothetical protein